MLAHALYTQRHMHCTTQRGPYFSVVVVSVGREREGRSVSLWCWHMHCTHNVICTVLHNRGQCLWDGRERGKERESLMLAHALDTQRHMHCTTQRGPYFSVVVVSVGREREGRSVSLWCWHMHCTHNVICTVLHNRGQCLWDGRERGKERESLMLAHALDTQRHMHCTTQRHMHCTTTTGAVL